jgi:radical SAM superfamily enzyme YgiQ (UPF0313 family)
MSYKYLTSYGLIDVIKKETGISVVVGGPHPSIIKERALKECAADYAVYGEGEFALAELAEGKDASSIEGLIWRDGGRIVVNPPRKPLLELDSLPFPDYEMFELGGYAQKRIPLTTARGCPHRCVYCAVDLLVGKRFRTRSPENVVDEIEYWYKKGYTDFGINDDTFTENVERAGRICDEIVKRRISISWDLRTGIRVDRVSRGLLLKLKAAGCKFIAFGIESVDPGVLDMMRKDIRTDLIEKAVTETKDCGIGVGGFFMIGTPGDTYATFRKTYEFAEKDVFDEVRFYNAEPYPGTEFFDWIKKNGTFLSEPEEYLNSRSRWEESPIFETPDFTSKERIKAFNEGEYLVTKKLIAKVAGRHLANIVSPAYRIKALRKMMLQLGFGMAPAILKLLGSKRKNENAST